MVDEKVINKVILGLQPNYCSMNEREKELALVSLAHNFYNEIRSELAMELFGTNIEDEILWWSSLSNEQKNLFDLHLADLVGIGKNKISLATVLPGPGKSLLDYDTVYSFDYEDFKAHKRMSELECSAEYLASYYRAFLPGTLLMMMHKNKVHYGMIISMANSLRIDILDYAYKIAAELIPSSVVLGPNHQKKAMNWTVRDRKRDAGGRERELAKLNDSANKFSVARKLVLDDMLDDQAPMILINTFTDGQSSNNIDIIVSNKTVLKQVHWKTFMDDIEKITDGREKYQQILNQEKVLAKAFMIKEHRKIILSRFAKIEDN